MTNEELKKEIKEIRKAVEALKDIYRVRLLEPIATPQDVSGEKVSYQGASARFAREDHFHRLKKSVSEEQSITAGIGISITNDIMRVKGSGGAVTITATPSLVGVFEDGQEITLQGTDDTNTLTIQDESILSGSKLELSSGANFTMGKGDIIVLVYNSVEDKFYEISRSNN
jgi:hypothetical protein